MKYATLIFSIFLTCICAFAQPTDYIAYYPFNNNANDESGNGNNASVTGAVITSDRFGNASSAYSFDGNDEISASFTLPTSNITVSVWARANTLSSNSAIINLSTSVGNDSWIRYNSGDGFFEGHYDNRSGGGLEYNIQTDADFGVWNHFVLHREGTNLSFYVNGRPITITIGDFTTDHTDLFIGSMDGMQYFDGEIDDVRIYNRALSESEIEELYLENRTQLVSSNPSLNSDDISRSSDISLTFDATIAQSSIDNSTPGDFTDDNILILGSQSGLFSGAFSGDGTSTITFDPSSDFEAGELITVLINESVTGSSGEVAVSEQVQFTTQVGGTSADFSQGENVIDSNQGGASNATGVDLDRDGDIDVVVSSGTDDKLTWFRNDGFGEFGSENSISTDVLDPEAIFPVDLDLDGDMDIVCASRDDSELVWFENVLSESFTERAISTGLILDIDVQDVDSDGDLDLVTAATGSSAIQWYENDGSQSFSLHTIGTMTAARSVNAVDLDEDGDLDVVATSAEAGASNKIVWYENDGSESFTENTISSGGDGAQDSQVADIDSDGNLDILIGAPNDLRWYQNDGSQSFTLQDIASSLSIGIRSIHVADLDGDNSPDIILGSGTALSYFMNDGVGNFSQTTVNSSASAVLGVTAVDLDGDFDLDILTSSSGSGTVSWYENAGEGSLIASYPFNNNTNDESNKGNDGTNNGATITTDRFGNATSAFSFDGTDDDIDISSGQFQFEESTSFTLNAWVNASSLDQGTILFSRTGSSGGYFRLYINSGAFKYDNNDGSSDLFVQASDAVETDRWYMVTGVTDRSSELMKLYIDGVEIGSTSVTGLGDLAFDTQRIGSWSSLASSTFFNGTIDDVQIYTRALSDTQIQELYSTGNWLQSSVATFKTTWQTTSNGESVSIPTTTGSYDYTVDWGDGTVLSGYNGDATHTYASAGTYSVAIAGDFPQIFFNSGNEGQQTTKIQSIDQWGAIQWASMSNAFEGCSNIRINATDAPDLSSVNSMFRMFFGAEALNDPVDHWDVSNVSLLSAVFEGAIAFNQPLNSWNTGSATDMLAMLNGASSFNQDLSNWDVSLVTDMTNLLANTAFNQSLGAWDISSVTVMTGMLDNVPMSSLNYDATLEGWSTLDAGEAQIPTGLSPGVNGLTYCTATDARNTLQTTFSWAISGDSEECGIEDGLVIYYPFNGDDTDASGNGLNPSDNGGVLASDRFGNASSAYTFDGTGTAITVTDGTAFDLAQMSYSSWFNLDDAAGDYTLIHFVGGFDIRFQGGELNLFNGSCDTQAFSGGSGAIGTGWHHVVFTFDDQSGFAFYLDGTLLFDGTLTGCTTIDVSELRIGYLDGANSSVISGSYDDIRLYNRVISLSEVGDLYTENGYIVPRVATLNTDKGIEGTTVKVYGAGFDGTSLDVQFDGQSATPTRISSNFLTFDVPTTSPGFKTFSVTNEFGNSAAQDFYVQGANTGLILGSENTISSALTSATDVHADDMNNDGRPDVLVWSFANGDLHFFLNNEDGSLNGSVIYNGASSSSNIKTGDLNRDGNKDIVFFIADGVSDGIYRMFGNGDGTFQAAVEVVDISNPRDIDLGDMDGDGMLDIVFSENGDTKWSRNRGNGLFDASIDISSGNLVGKLELFDLENDGNLDIAHVGSTVNSFTVGSGDGVTFTTNVIGTNPTNGSDEVVVGDITGDGLDDWITGAFNDHNVDLDINQNAGGGSFDSFPADINSSDTYLGVNALDLADLDGDGDQELLAGFFNSDNVVVYVNSGSGDASTFTDTEIISDQTDVASVITADLDLDGDLDIIVAREDGNVVWIEAEGALTLTGIDQTEGAPGDELTLFGTAFDLDQDKNVVQVGGVPAAVTEVSGDGKSLKFNVPSAVSTGTTTITLTVNGNTVTLDNSFEVIILTQVTNLAASVSSTTATLVWDAHPDGLVTEYQVFRSNSPGASVLFATVSSPTYEDAGLMEGANYYYRVKASDGGTNVSGFSKEVSAAIQNSSGTDVSGNLIENDTWTIAGSPYNIVGDIGVPSAFSLTIEPGVVVNYTGDFRILVFGEINVNGVESNPVTFNGNSVEGSKYMLEIRQTVLDNSNIDHANFTGPQWALLEGLQADTEFNTGDLQITGGSFSNTRLNVYAIDGGSTDPVVVLSNLSLNNVILSGNSSQIFNGRYPYQLVNSVGEDLDLIAANLRIQSSVVSNMSGDITGETITAILIEDSDILDTALGQVDDTFQIGRLEVNGSRLSGFNVDKVTEVAVTNSIFASPFTGTGAFFSDLDPILDSRVENASFIGDFTDTALQMSADMNSLEISNSTFQNLNIAISASYTGNNAGSLSISGSNFLGSATYHIENQTVDAVNAQSNYWDSNSASIIAGKILDSNDDLELGEVDFSNRLTAHNPAAPISAPENVVQSDDGGGGLDISWSANEESDVAGYRVHWGSFNGFQYENVSDVGNVTSTNIIGLTESDEVAVTAYDADSDGSNDMTDGNESWYTVAATPPAAPTATAATDNTTASFTANWEAVDGASSYRLDVATDDTFTNLVSGFNNLQVFGTSQSVTGLSAGTTYHYRIRAENAAGVSASSDAVETLTFLFEKGATTSLPNFSGGNLIPGDFDNDSDYDVLIGGSGSSVFTELYENSAGAFSTSTFDDALRVGVIYDFQLTDFNNDGNVDVIYGGEETLDNRFSELYINSGSTFTEILDNQIADPNLNGGPNYLWVDVDNNGTDDLLHSSEEKFFINNLSILSEGFDINGLFEPGSFFDVVKREKGDYDQDGDLDVLLIYNNESLQRKAAIVQNNSDGFSLIDFPSINESGSGSVRSVDWVDFNSDGYLDIVVTENAAAANSIDFYLFDGSSYPSSPSDSFGLGDYFVNDFLIGDFDNDGDYDIYLRGFENTFHNFKFLANEAGVLVEQFTSQLFAPSEPTSFSPSHIDLFDFDLDNDLDVLVIFEQVSSDVPTIAENKSATSNNAPAAPTNLNSSISGGNVTLSWDKATDDTTPQDGLSYEIYIGTTSGSQDIRSPKSDLATGFRKIVGRGDLQGNSWTIKGLAVGTYYWSVQAIDASYAGGAFAGEQTFEVTANPKLTFSTDFDISQARVAYEGSIDVSAQLAGFGELTFNSDGTKMYVLDHVPVGRNIEQFSLSTPYDVRTASYDNVSFDVSAQFQAPTGLHFSQNGLKLFVTGVDDSNGPLDPELVYQYSLSSAFDISSPTIEGSYDYSAQQISSTGLEFSRDGTKMLVVGVEEPEVNMYNLTTPFDFTNGVSFNSVLDVSSQVGTPVSVFFSPTGKVLLVAGQQQISIYSVGNDLNDATFVDSFDISTEIVQGNGLEFSPDGKRFYVLDVNDNVIHQYRLNLNIFSINETDNTIVDGKMIISLQDETFVNAGGVLSADTHYLTNIALTQQMAVSSDGSFVELTLSNPSNLTNGFTPTGEIAIDFTDAAFSTFAASQVEGAVDEVIGFGIQEPLAVTDGLVAYYPFIGDATDQSGNSLTSRLLSNFDVPVSPTLGTDRFGNINSALQFDNSNVHLEVDVNESIPQEITFTAWINFTDFDESDQFALIQDPHAQVFINNSQLRYSCLSGVNSCNVTTSSSTPILENEWRMVSYTLRNDGSLDLYIDGQVEVSTTIVYEGWSGPQTLDIIYIAGGSHSGLIDDIRIYNQALQGADIEAIYEAERPAAGNNNPTDISLSNDEVLEQQSVGTLVGQFSTTDADAGDTHAYSFVAGAGDADNGSFTISGNELLTNEVFNFEAQATYSIRVQTDDGNGGTLAEIFLIEVLEDSGGGANNTPTDISLSNDEIAEGQPVSTLVGQLTTTDADVADTHTYSLVSGAGDTNNGSFNISGDQLLTTDIFDFDTQSSYSIRIQTDDGRENGTFQKAFTITILDSTGESPTAINLTASAVDENSPVGTAVGSLSTTDPDDPENDDTYTYSIVGGASSQFSIQNGNELVTSVGLDFEAQTFYSITIRSLDPGNLFLDEDFSISVQNVNPQASDLVLSNSSIIEGVAAGSTIGNFQVEGTEGRSSYVYSIVGGGSEFGITGNELTIADGVSAGTYTIDVLAEDNSGPDQVQNSFDILVSAVNAATSVSFGTDVTNYRIIGLPTQSARVSSVFPDLAAGDAGETWRIVSYTNGDFSDLTPASTMNSGTGYWFLAAESTTIDLTSLTPIQGDEASIQLRPEWNLISNPFLASLNVSEAITFSIGEGLLSDGDLSSLYAYNENVISSLDVLQGGWIRNRTGGTVTLRLPNPTATSTGRKAPNGRRVEESWYEDNANWQLIVHMQDGARSSNLGAVGMRSNASDGIDRTDLTGPPLIAENASFRLSDRNGLVRNFKPYTGEGKRWDFQITAPQHQSVTLSWDSNMINQLDQKLYLYDPSRNVSYNMSAINSMRLPADASFEVLSGDAVREETIQIPVLMYPNPASEVLYVEFFIEGNQLEIPVELTIFDMLGREVKAKTRSFAPNAFGSFELYNMDLPAGTYVLHVKYGGRNSQPQKLIIK